MFTFQIRGKTYSFKDAHYMIEMFEFLRDDSGEGASTWPTPLVRKNGTVVARISYNGRVWPNKEWTPELKSINLEDL